VQFKIGFEEMHAEGKKMGPFQAAGQLDSASEHYTEARRSHRIIYDQRMRSASRAPHLTPPQRTPPGRFLHATAIRVASISFGLESRLRYGDEAYSKKANEAWPDLRIQQEQVIHFILRSKLQGYDFSFIFGLSV